MLATATTMATEKPWVAASPELDTQQFRQWAALLRERTGITLAPERRSFMASALHIRMQEIGVGDFQEYYDFITSPRGGVVEWATLVDRLTVHETRFFRHPPSLQRVREHLPQQAADCAQPYTLQLWSVGCASGEEAYSLAIVLDEHLRSVGCHYRFGVTATDISLAALNLGRAGIYPAQRLNQLSAAQRAYYFEPLGDGRFRVKDGLRERVCFTQLNVQELDEAPFKQMDIIYCQNLLIYFERGKRVRIVEQLAQFLRPGGLLVLGVGEMVGWQPSGLVPVGGAETLAFVRQDATVEGQG